LEAAVTSELDPQARALIGLALQGEQRLPRHRERVRRGVLAALATPAALGATEAALAAGKTAIVSSAASSGAKAALLSIPLIKAVPLVVLGVAAGVVGLQHIRSPARRQATSIAAAPAVGAASASRTGHVVVAAGTEATSPADSAPATSSAPLKTARPTPPNSIESSLAPPPSLATELDALQRAQRALNAGNATSALVELQAVKGAALRAERTALEVFAHCALGNTATARKQAALFRKLAPHSPLLPRVQASCAHD
jgi:hypothetical protein